VLPVTLDSPFLIFVLSRKKIKQISRMENPESQATQYQRKKIKQISGMENPESQARQYQRKKIKQIFLSLVLSCL
jgi:hypothetical protein